MKKSYRNILLKRSAPANGNETSIPSITIVLGIPASAIREEKKKFKDVEKEKNNSLFIENMIVYVEYPNELKDKYLN